MTLKEVMQALIDGKKVRHKDWESGEFMCFKDSMLVDHCGDECSIGTVCGHAYFEIFQEPKYVYKFAVKYPDHEFWVETSVYYVNEDDFLRHTTTDPKVKVKRLDYTRLEL